VTIYTTLQAKVLSEKVFIVRSVLTKPTLVFGEVSSSMPLAIPPRSILGQILFMILKCTFKL
jgi:hypothetical protein